MKNRINLTKAAFAAAVTAALTFGAQAAFAEGRGGGQQTVYCFAASSKPACIGACSGNGDLFRSYSLGQCCCIDEG